MLVKVGDTIINLDRVETVARYEAWPAGLTLEEAQEQGVMEYATRVVFTESVNDSSAITFDGAEGAALWGFLALSATDVMLR